MMKNYKKFSFWTALAGAVTVLASALGKCFGFSVDNQIITDVIMAIAGVLVVLGVVTMPKNQDNNQEKQDDNHEIQENQNDKSNQESEQNNSEENKKELEQEKNNKKE